MKLPRANCVNAGLDRQLTKIDMKKPNVRGPSPRRKAHLVLREKLNRKSKPAPAWPVGGEGGEESRQSVGRSVYGKD
ncbi:MAG TPA: hypothetical protein VEP30_07075 [Chthoniobacterales bacterium]|jgi:hypothetical protein|nr:hypothetical protein [Chthoniobacterales bacterium]